MRDFRELTRQQMIDGVIANMVVAVELIQKVIDPMCQRKFGRIVNITSGSVKMPLAGLDLSSGARAGLTAFLAGVARTVADKNVTINNILPGAFDTDRLRGNTRARPPNRRGKSVDQVAADRMATIPAQALRQSGRIRRGLRVPVLGAGRLHHRAESADRRRHVQRRVLGAETTKAGVAAGLRLVRHARRLFGDQPCFTGAAGSSQRYLMPTEMMSTCAVDVADIGDRRW